MWHLWFVFVSLVGVFGLVCWVSLNLFPLGEGNHYIYLADVNPPVIL